jgi:hypothetical protein
MNNSQTCLENEQDQFVRSAAVAIAPALRWQIHDDGTFDIVSDTISVRGSYPGCDGRSVRPLAVRVERNADGGTITCELLWGRLDLTLTREGHNLVARCKVSNCEHLPGHLDVFADALVEGATKFYRLGQGIADNSGFRALPPKETLNAFGICGFTGVSGSTLVVACRDFRRFQSRAIVTSASSAQSGFKYGFRTEAIACSQQEIELPAIYISQVGDAWNALRAEAQACGEAMGALLQKPTSYHWCSWYDFYYHLDQNTLDDYLNGFAALPDKANVQSIQIDAGYFPHAGDWLEHNHLWPHGLQYAFDRIAAAGFQPGIWIGPYMVGCRSRLYGDHPDWMLRRNDGELVREWVHYGEQRIWGQQDEEYYVLDTSHPAAMGYLRQVFRTLYSWGVRFFKTDFIYWGYLDSSQVQRHTPGKTSHEYLIDMFDMIRQEIGDSYWLGCIAPFEPMIGYVDGMRIGSDVSPEQGSAASVYRESIGCQIMNNVWWQNDPDAMLLRARRTHKNADEVYSDALWFGMLGGVVNTSDALHEEPADRLALWRFLRPRPDKTIALFPYFDRTLAPDPVWGQAREFFVMTREYAERDAWALLFLNEQDRDMRESFSMRQLCGAETLYVWRWEPQKHEFLGEMSRLEVKARPRASCLYYVSLKNEPPTNRTLGGAFDSTLGVSAAD